MNVNKLKESNMPHKEESGLPSKKKASTSTLQPQQIQPLRRAMSMMLVSLALLTVISSTSGCGLMLYTMIETLNSSSSSDGSKKLYQDGVIQLDYKSCEMMSDDLYLQIAARYPGRAVWIEVSEDGENGALIKYETHRPNINIAI
jgi:hypothetical protein